MVPPDIYIKAVGTEAYRQLTKTPFPEMFPAWSPDGTQMAFARPMPRRIRGLPTWWFGAEISDTAGYVRWTPDGQSLLIRQAAAGRFGEHLSDQPEHSRTATDTSHRRRVPI
jgi:Tol biopolymer transport system component